MAAAGAPDPIFAAIEAHQIAFMRNLQLSEIYSETAFDAPEHKLNQAVAKESQEADHDAAFKLADTVPTTMAGVPALIDYVREFNQGKFKLNDGWASGAIHWPPTNLFDFEGLRGEPDEDLGMPYVVLLNVRAALANLSGGRE